MGGLGGVLGWCGVVELDQALVGTKGGGKRCEREISHILDMNDLAPLLLPSSKSYRTSDTVPLHST